MTIVIPVWNTQRYLDQCLDSVLGQSHRQLEVIAVDDGSRDASLRILQDHERQDARLRILTQENKGPGAARNRALAEAAGDWVYFTDSDDYMHPRCIERLLEEAVAHDADLALSTAVSFDDRSGGCIDDPAFSSIWFPVAFDRSGLTPANYPRKEELLRVNLAPWAKLIHRDLASRLRFPENVRRYEDNPFVYEALLKARRVALVREQLYYHRRREDSIQGRIAKGEDTAATLEDLIAIRLRCLEIFSHDPELAALHRRRSADQLWKFYTRLPVRLRRSYRAKLRRAFGAEVARYFMVKRLKHALVVAAYFPPHGIFLLGVRMLRSFRKRPAQ